MADTKLHYRTLWFDYAIDEVVDVVMRARKLGFNPEELLRLARNRFEQRYDEEVERDMDKRGHLQQQQVQAESSTPRQHSRGHER